MAQYQGGDIGAYVLVRERVGHEDLLPEPADFSDQLTVSDVCEEDVELKVVDLYAVRAESDETQKKGTKPFIHQVKLHGPKGEVVRVWGLFDNRAMVYAMSTDWWLPLLSNNLGLSLGHQIYNRSIFVKGISMAISSLQSPTAN
jgi:hypothetical protein